MFTPLAVLLLIWERNGVSGIRSPNYKPDIKARMSVVVEGGKGWWPSCMLSIPCLVKTVTSIRLTKARVVGGRRWSRRRWGSGMSRGGPSPPCPPPWARCQGLTLHGSALPQETSNLVSRFVYEFNPRTSFHANCLRHMTLLQHKSASHWILFLKKFAFWILFKYSTAKGQDGWKIGCPFFSSQTFSSWLGTFVKLLCFTFFPESGCVWVKNDFHRHYSLDTFGSKWLSQAAQPGYVWSKMTFTVLQ